MRRPYYSTSPAADSWGSDPGADVVAPDGQPWTIPFDPRASQPDGLHHDHLYEWESFAAPPTDNTEPYSLQWFLAIEHQRNLGPGRWIARLLEFSRHAGETLLGLGGGLGTDLLQYARNGAHVIACCPRLAELALIRRNFELRGLSGRFVHAQPTNLPLANSSIDVACVQGVLQEAQQPADIVRELLRVLKPGGKVLAVVPARYDIDYWRRCLWPWRSRSAGSASAESHLLSSSTPPKTFSARRLHKLFADMTDHRLHKRQLSRREVPWTIRWLPRSWLERLFGRVLVLKAFKPINPSQPSLAAA